MTFVIGRFVFDYFEMKRIKLNDYVDFPFVLNMNEYIKLPGFSIFTP